NGIFKVDVQRLEALNSIEDVSIFTLFDGQLVSKGKTVAGVKVTPFVVNEARLREAEDVAGFAGVVQVLAFRPMRVAVLVRARRATRAAQCGWRTSLTGRSSGWPPAGCSPGRPCSTSSFRGSSPAPGSPPPTSTGWATAGCCRRTWASASRLTAPSIRSTADA